MIGYFVILIASIMWSSALFIDNLFAQCNVKGMRYDMYLLHIICLEYRYNSFKIGKGDYMGALFIMNLFTQCNGKGMHYDMYVLRIICL